MKPARLSPSGFNPRGQAGTNASGLSACALRLPSLPVPPVSPAGFAAHLADRGRNDGAPCRWAGFVVRRAPVGLKRSITEKLTEISPRLRLGLQHHAVFGAQGCGL